MSKTHGDIHPTSSNVALTNSAAPTDAQTPKVDIDFLEAGGLSFRRMVVRGPRANGTVLLLHGFPESVYAWTEIAMSLGRDYEVHAFDWPGYGLGSRPGTDAFSYSPRDYARILGAYIEASNIDKTKLTIYATDLGGLPALLLALEDPQVAQAIIVGDFAPFDRLDQMSPRLQALKSPSSSEAVRLQMNASRDEILQNIFTRGLPDEARYEVSQEFREDIERSWTQNGMTPVDALAHYYRHFSRDQQYLESNIGRLKTPVKVIWGEKDLFISKDMGAEFAEKVHVPLTVLPDVGHFPHLQVPAQVIAEIRATFA
jgi:pimeloyl-ACP methyl ester carboxylesterase